LVYGSRSISEPVEHDIGALEVPNATESKIGRERRHVLVRTGREPNQRISTCNMRVAAGFLTYFDTQRVERLLIQLPRGLQLLRLLEFSERALRTRPHDSVRRTSPKATVIEFPLSLLGCGRASAENAGLYRGSTLRFDTESGECLSVQTTRLFQIFRCLEIFEGCLCSRIQDAIFWADTKGSVIEYFLSFTNGSCTVCNVIDSFVAQAQSVQCLPVELSGWFKVL